MWSVPSGLSPPAHDAPFGAGCDLNLPVHANLPEIIHCDLVVAAGSYRYHCLTSSGHSYAGVTADNALADRADQARIAPTVHVAHGDGLDVGSHVEGPAPALLGGEGCRGSRQSIDIRLRTG